MRSYFVVALAAVSLTALDTAARSANDWSLSTWHAGPRSKVAYVEPRTAHVPVRWREARRVRSDRPRAEPAHSYLRERPMRLQCADRVRGLGTQWIGEAGALEAAEKDWREKVRFDLGEQFMDLNYAEDYVKRCNRTSIGEVAGQVFYRCELVARPCKPSFERIEGKR